MAGAGLITIKRRIKSINNTKKITKAMGLVANSKLRKTRETLTQNNDFHIALKEIMREVLWDNDSDTSIYFNHNGSNKKLYIVFTSDTGLCGGFNGNVVNKALEYTLKDKENSCLFVIGQKGIAYLKRYNLKLVDKFVEVPNIPTIKDAVAILSKVQELYIKGDVGEVSAIYTKFTSAFKQEIIAERILPVDRDSISKDYKYGNIMMEYEPERERIIPSICKLYLKQSILNILLNSKASEQSARMSAMEAAAKNANDLLDKLNIKYNRLRQTTITQEISEVVGGAEAQR